MYPQQYFNLSELFLDMIVPFLHQMDLKNRIDNLINPVLSVI